MTESQRLQIKMSQTREAANDETISPEARTRLLGELRDLEVKFRSALEAQTDQVNEDFAHHTPLTAEFREQQEVTRRADLGTILGTILARQNTSGAEAEAQQAWGLEGDQLPMSMIAELRTVAAPTDGGGVQGAVGYVFPRSLAQVANISRVHVPAGVHTYPSFQTAGAAGRPAEGAAHASTEPTLRGQLLTPHRIVAQAGLSVEDRARFSGLPQALGVHLAGLVAAGMDQQALLDDNGFFDTSNRPLTIPVDPGSATTYVQWAAILAQTVDGRRSSTPGEGGIIMHPDGFNDADVLYRNATAPESFAERLARVTRLSVNSSMPGATANVVTMLVVRGRTPAAVQAIWPGLRIEDIYTGSGTGLITFTAVAMAAFSVQDTGAYAAVKINNS